MNSYEKLLNLFRGQVDNTFPFFIGEMTDDTTCKIGNLVLEKDDLFFTNSTQHLTAGDEVLVIRLNDEKFIIVERIVEL